MEQPEGTTMLKPEKVAQLSPEKLAEVLDYEALQWYGTDRYKTSLARDFGIARSTIANWTHAPHQIPIAVVLCLSAWNALHHAKLDAAAAVHDYAGQLSKLADRLQS
jgi:hypothetical protein